MTMLSVNVNKIALLRNSRGRDFPNLVGFIEMLIKLGVKGVTVHPRPDERHVTQADVFSIAEFLADFLTLSLILKVSLAENFWD